MRLRICADVHGLVAELHANQEQPRCQNKTELPVGQARSEGASGQCPEKTANEKLHQQRSVEVLTEQVQTSANQREAEAEGKICPDDLRRAERGKAEQSDCAKRARQKTRTRLPRRSAA